MHTVDLLEQATVIAGRLGIGIRHDWLGGNGGAICELKGQTWLFLDLGQTPAEQLEMVLRAIRQQPQAGDLQMSDALRERLALRKSA